jgi:hypothetical protein
MTEYLVKLGFWLRAYDSVTIEAANDSEAIGKAKQAAKTAIESRAQPEAIESRAQPEAIDTDERREGIIAYVDRLDPDCRKTVAEGVAFYDDRIHVPLLDFVRRVAALTPTRLTQIAHCADATCRCQAFMDEARKLLDDGA